MWLAFIGPALAHDYEIHTLGPNADWCAELHRVASPGDVINLLPGSYPGGCRLTIGGLESHNEALLLTSLEGTAVIEADLSGLSLAVHASTTRLYALEFRGRLEVAAPNTKIDGCTVPSLQVDDEVPDLTLLFNRFVALDLQVDDLVFRGNLVEDLQVSSTTGLVADNTILGSAHSTVRFHRNLVEGDLDVSAEAFANVVVGDVDARGALYGNTLLGDVLAHDARNNLTTTATLDASQGNLKCDTCLRDGPTLDVRGTGAALETPPVEAPGHTFDFCNSPGSAGIGALVEVHGTDHWTAYDRGRQGCGIAGLQPIPVVIEEPAPTARTCSHTPSFSWVRRP